MRFRKPTPAFAVAVAALVVSLSGTSYAVSQIGGIDIKDDSIRSVDIHNGTLRTADFFPGVLKKGTTGEKGDQGIQGPAGAGRWLLVNADGTIAAQSGGFEITTAYDLVNNSGAAVPAGALGNVYIDANEDLSNNGIVTSIALQNQVDQNGDTIKNGRAPGADANPEFSGEISATRCAIDTVVACAPTGANDTKHLVVSPRMSDGSVTVSPVAASGNVAEVIGTHKRFYVIISGDSSDYVAPAA
ncbi:MAG: hypothetical protein JWQ74_1485 [Marmoricola sp.]|nr:hypothetical protein [Marmoricola sp.]